MNDQSLFEIQAGESAEVGHDVTLPTGETVHNPIRVLPNGDGREVVFTLFHAQTPAREPSRSPSILMER